MSELKDCPSLPRSQWDAFTICPNHELIECRSFDYLSEVTEFRKAIIYWRRQIRDNTFEAYLELDRSGRRAPAQSQTCSFWPEWPTQAYMSVPASERERRLRILFPGNPEVLIARQLEPDSALLLDSEEGFQNIVRQLRKTWQASRRLHVCPNSFEEHALFKIPWWRSNKEILQLLEAWLKANSPPDRKLYVQEGAGTFERRLRIDLKALGALRVLRANNDDWTGDPTLYAEQKEWIEARNRAQEIIRGLSDAIQWHYTNFGATRFR
jgi:hypothetical protein